MAENESEEPRPPDEPSAEAGWRPGDRKIAEPDASDGELRCGYCRAPIEDDQTYCLQCGSPTPRAPRLRGARGAAALIAAGLLALGAGSGVLAYFVAQDDEDDAAGVTTTAITIPPSGDAGDPSTSPIPPDTGIAPTDPFPGDPTDPTDTGGLPTDTTATDTVTVPDDPFPTVTGPDADPPEPTTTEEIPVEPDPFPDDPVEPDPDPIPDDPSVGSDWPAGRTGWTAFLSSVRDEADARAAASRLESSGQSAGVLFSSDHPNLEPGFWVVYSGVFDAQGPAASRAGSLTGEFPGAYARRVVS